MSSVIDAAIERAIKEVTTKPTRGEVAVTALISVLDVLGLIGSTRKAVTFWQTGRRGRAVLLTLLPPLHVAIQILGRVGALRIRTRGLLQRAEVPTGSNTNAGPDPMDAIREMILQRIRESYERNAPFDPNSVDLGVRKTDERGFVDPIA